VRALVTGAAGQLGIEVLRTAPSSFDVVGLSHRECDITDRAQIDAKMEAFRPDLVINAAAFTAVDQAETAYDIAYTVNATGAGNVARGAVRVGARLVHISTDYVFDGASDEPYAPDDSTNPINKYGESKLAGEQEVLRNSPGSLIVRSSWLYASYGKNFLRTILSGLHGGQPLRVVNDQTGVPTAARSLAFAIWECAKRPELSGIQHWVDGGTATWYDFAVAIQALALERRMIPKAAPISRVTSAEYGFPAPRPRYSVLDASGLAGKISREPRPWLSWLAEVIKELG